MERVGIFMLLSFAVATQMLPAEAANASSPGTTRLYVGTHLGDSVVGGLLGLQINKSFSLEVRYDFIDNVNQPTRIVEASCVGIAGIGMYPVRLAKMKRLFIFLKAGYEQTTSRTTVNDPGIPGLFPPTTTITNEVTRRPVAGAGVHHDFSSSFSGRFGLNAVGSDHSIYVAAIYKF